MKTLTLDYSKWRCGRNSEKPENKLGTGPTLLLNTSGYMCCLGQFSSQLKAELTKSDLMYKSTPSQLLNVNKGGIPYLTKQYGVFSKNTEFSNSAISINDDRGTSVEQKIDLLRKLMKKVGLKLRVINKPKIKNKK
jgi:hypothetical protein